MSDTLKAGLIQRLGITDAELNEDGLLAALDEALTEQAETAAPAGAVLIDAGVLATLQENAAEGVTARAEQIKASRDALIEAAAADGRVTPATKAAWRKALDENEASTAPLLAALPTNKAVPVVPMGHAEASDEDSLYRRIYPGTDTSKEA